MKKIKVSEATNLQINWLVAKCKERILDGQVRFLLDRPELFAYSTDWSQGGPIIDREFISTNAPVYPSTTPWRATASGTTDLDTPLWEAEGSTPLLAAMRCYVASKLGDEVEVPEELG